MPINAQKLKQGLKEGGKILGLGGVSGLIGAGIGASEGVKYNQGGLFKKPTKGKEERKKNIKHFALVGGALGALGIPALYIGAKGKLGRKWYESVGSAGAKARKHPSDFKDMFKEHDIDLKKIKTKEQFTKTYRNLAKKYHPDVNKTPGAEEKFKDINNAVENLRKSDWYEKLALLLDSLGFEKFAEDKNRAVETGLGAGIGSLAYDAGKGALATGKGGLKAGLKSMAEKAGGKGNLVKNLLKQHGPTGLIVGATAGGILAARNATKKRNEAERRSRYEGKVASYRNDIEGIEKVAFSGFNTRRKLRKTLELWRPIRSR